MVAWHPTTVAWPSAIFSKFSQIAWNVGKTLFDSRPTVAWPQPLSRDRSATFFKIFPNRLKRQNNVDWQSADGRVTSDHCRVTVQRLFSKTFLIAWNVGKTLFDSRPMVALPPTTVAWPSAIFSKFSQIAWNVGKTLFDSRPTVAWPPTTVAWPFSDFFQTFFQLLDTSENSCLKVSGLSRDGPATLFPWFFFVRASHTASQMYISLFFFLSAKSLATYLLLQEWSDPGNFDIISKLGIGRREFLILAGKFQLVDSPWGEQIPHYKHRRRSITYLLREIPVKNRERWDWSQQTGKLSG